MGLLSKAAVKQAARADLRAVINAYQTDNLSFNCIVLHADAQSVNAMVSAAGAVQPLGGGKCLILLPLSVDRELLAHRLSKTLNAEILCQCAANSSDTVLEAITSCT
jgi:hypothetical protein